MRHIRTCARQSGIEIQISECAGQVHIDNLLDNLPAIEAEPLLMHQLLQNLIDNALKFRRAGVSPIIVVAARYTDPNTIEMTVQDNGIGFDEKYRDRIFTPFQRLHGTAQYEGAGMGLAICRKIAERHGGHITAHSTPMQGATFVVTLPVRSMK